MKAFQHAAALSLWMLSSAVPALSQSEPLGAVRMEDWGIATGEGLGFQHRLGLSDVEARLSERGQLRLSWRDQDLLGFQLVPEPGIGQAKRVPREEGAGGYALLWPDTTGLDLALTRDGKLFLSATTPKSARGLEAAIEIPLREIGDSLDMITGEDSHPVPLDGRIQALPVGSSLRASGKDSRSWSLTLTEGPGVCQVLPMPWGWKASLGLGPEKTSLLLDLSQLVQTPHTQLQPAGTANLLDPTAAPSELIGPDRRRWRIRCEGATAVTASLAGTDPKAASLWVRSLDQDRWQRIDLWTGSPLSFVWTSPWPGALLDLEARASGAQDPLSLFSAATASCAAPQPAPTPVPTPVP